MSNRGTRYPGVRYRNEVLYYRVKYANGKWIEIRFGKGTPKQAFLAREERQTLEDSIRAGRVDPRQQEMEKHAARPIAELVTEYGEHLQAKGDSDAHVTNTKRFVNQCTAACHVKHILELDPHRVNRWVSDLHLSARSKNARRTAILGLCRWASDYGRAPRNPIPSGLVSRFDEEADRRRLSRAMDRGESEALFATLLDPEKMSGHCHTGAGHMSKAKYRRAFYVLAAHTGLRWREIARLRWCDVDLDAALVVVPAGQTKNGKEAELPLVGPVVDALRGILGEADRITDRVFCGAPSLKTWKRDLQRAGIIGKNDEGYIDSRGRRLDRKCLRMSFCTWLKEAGVDLRDAQRLMRHSDPKLTASVYTDLRVKNLRAAVAKLLGTGEPDHQAVKEQRTA